MIYVHTFLFIASLKSGISLSIQFSRSHPAESSFCWYLCIEYSIRIMQFWVLIRTVHLTNNMHVRIYMQYILRITKTNVWGTQLGCFGLSTFWTVKVLIGQRSGLSTFWSFDVLVYLRFGLSTSWVVDVLVCRRFGLSTFWCAAVSVYRRFGCRRFGLSTF